MRNKCAREDRPMDAVGAVDAMAEAEPDALVRNKCQREDRPMDAVDAMEEAETGELMRNKRQREDRPMDAVGAVDAMEQAEPGALESGMDSKRHPSFCCTSQQCALYYKKTFKRGQCDHDVSDWCLGCKANWETLKLRQGFNRECKDVSHFFNHGGALRSFETCKECGVLKRIDEISHSVCLDCFKRRKAALKAAKAEEAALKAAEAKEVQPTLSEEEMPGLNNHTRPDMSVCLLAFSCALRAMEEAKSRP